MKTSFIALLSLLDSDNQYRYWLDEGGKHRRDRRIPCFALRTYRFSTFLHLYTSGNDQALINATGHDFHSFSKLLNLFAPVYYYWTFDDDPTIIRRKVLTANGVPKGKPRDMTACGCLGLVLVWFRTKGSCARALSLVFGQTSSPLYKWLKFGRRVLLHVLSRVPEAQVKVPTSEEVASFKEAVVSKYVHCPNVWGACDGLKLLIEPPQSYSKQRRYYNRWTHGHYISCAFVFSVDGKIRMSVLNAPGNFHGNTLADYCLYGPMEMIYERDGGQVVVDRAF